MRNWISEAADRAVWRVGIPLTKLARRWLTHLAQQSWRAETLLGEAGFDTDRLARHSLDGCVEVVTHGPR